MATKSKSSVDTSGVTTTGYVESEDHVPNPLFQYGTLDTSDTAAASAGELMFTTSPVFEVGRARTMLAAARALDPDDTEVSAELVTLPSGGVQMWGTSKTADEGREEVLRAAAYYEQNPVHVGSGSAAPSKSAETASTSGTTGSTRSSTSSS